MLVSDDLFAEWKTKRFIIADSDLIDQPGKILIILTDIKYWADNIDDLIAWCEINGGKPNGMTVYLETQEQLTMFILRWS